MTGYCDGIFLPVSEMTVPVTSLSVNRGYGAFEFFEVINGKPFFGELHLSRFENSLRLLRIDCGYEMDKVKFSILEIIDRNRMSSGFIKMFALPHFPVADQFYKASLYIFPVLQEPSYSKELYSKGAGIELRKFSRFLPEAKSTNYLSGQYWNDGFADSSVVDVLYYDDESVRETSRGNVFMVCNHELLTPSKGVLKGITRQIVLDYCQRAGLKSQLSLFSPEQLMAADEVFLTSTTKHILPIVEIDGKKLATGIPGPVTLQLMAELNTMRSQYGISEA